MIKIYADAIDKVDFYDLVIKTPLEKLTKISKTLNNMIYIKREDLQIVHSFKIRGAYHKIRQLNTEQQQSQLITASAGNHAQGVALAAHKMGYSVKIFMPKTSPTIKVDAVRAYGATVVLFGDNYDDALTQAKSVCESVNGTFIHPYDDPNIIVGQGTIGKEILEIIDSKPYAIFIPVGGGGLLAGISSYFKIHSPQTKIIAVEPENAASLDAAIKANKRLRLPHVGIFADGVAVKQIGAEPYEVAKVTVDDNILVTTDDICAAIKDIYEDNRSIAEPAGALGLAGIKKYLKIHPEIQSKTLVTIETGSNINFDRLRHVAERADIGENREAIFAVTIPETPGSFREFCDCIGNRSISEFNYRYATTNSAHIFLGVKLSNGYKERTEILSQLQTKGYDVTDLTDDETSKIHIRYMVGGKSASNKPERLFRIHFPERSGALNEFLQKLGPSYNISLFHYRNHGADFGRVLMGIHADPMDTGIEERLSHVGFYFVEETSNPAFHLFL